MPPFQWQPPPSLDPNGTLADLMLRGPDAVARAAQNIGQINANAQQQSGQDWARATDQVGQIAAAVPQQIQQAQAQQQEQQIRQSQIDEVTQKRKDLAALDTAFQQPGGRDAILSALPGHLRPTVQKQFSEADEAGAKATDATAAAAKATSEYVVGLGRTVAANNYDPAAMMLALGHARETFANNPPMLAQLTQFQQQLLSNPTPDGVKAIIDPILKADQASKQKPVEPFTLAPGDTRFDATGKPIAAVAPKPANVEAKSMLVDGKPAEVVFSPSTGKYSLAATGEDVSSRVTPVTPRVELQSKSVLVNGKPAEVIFHPNTGKYSDTNGQEIPGSSVRPIPPAASVINPQVQSDVQQTIQGMKDGTLPPLLPGRATKEYNALMAEAHRQGFDLASAATDWSATQKHIATLNGPQQTRLMQSINALPDLLDSVDALAGKWNGGQFPILNKANLALAKQGAFGKDAASLANQLDAQIADVNADLGTVYMGGNTPTDQALGLAKKALSGDWDRQVLTDMVGLARKNVGVRKNSIQATGVQGIGPNNPYAQPTPAAAAPPVGKTFKLVNGQWVQQ